MMSSAIETLFFSRVVVTTCPGLEVSTTRAIPAVPARAGWPIRSKWKRSRRVGEVKNYPFSAWKARNHTCLVKVLQEANELVPRHRLERERSSHVGLRQEHEVSAAVDAKLMDNHCSDFAETSEDKATDHVMRKVTRETFNTTRMAGPRLRKCTPRQVSQNHFITWEASALAAQAQIPGLFDVLRPPTRKASQFPRSSVSSCFLSPS
jgi:hypothetical protein